VRVVWWSWLARASVALLVVIAGLLAWIEGGGADARVRPPQPDGIPMPADAGGQPSAGRDGYEVKMRLVEALGDAVIDVPNLAASQPYFQAHWRKLRGPWLHPAGVAGELVTTIALPARKQVETQWGVSARPDEADAGAGDSGAKKAWIPDVRVWNMNEGSFDQREAIYAPTPATLIFQVMVPHGARLRFSLAVATALPATTWFDVTLIDAAGGEHEVSEARVAPDEDRRWMDIDADLGPWGGQKAELRLRTWATPERHWTPPPNAEPTASDGGVERMVVPPMALALWGDPVIVAKGPTRVPFNVVWIVVDAMRPDIAASLHDPDEDAAKLAALRPPLDALLPVIPGLMPAIDHLAARGVHFTHAWSAAAWTRPGTLAMLTGERSSELGIDTTNWVQPMDRIARYYASDPPLLPRVLRKSGVTTAAFVNNFFMSGYANVGLDMGFERITDHRYRTRDTALITYDAFAWLDAHAGDRFFLFVNYNSPHAPYDPPKEMLARIPPPPAAPRDGQVRAYMAEAAKDDTAIGALLEKLDALGLAPSTLVVVSSDHGETLSAAHDGFGLIGSDKMPMRFHHAVGNFEETTRVPLVMALPGVIDGGRAVRERVRSIDIAPTILELEGLEVDARMSGRSLLPLVRGRKEPEPRVVVSEGRFSRAVLWDRWRLVVHDAPAHPPTQPDGGRPPPPPEDELYDLDEDPGERRNVARLHADVVAEMHARLTAALANAPAADAPPATAATPLPTVHLRFAGGGRTRRVTGIVTVGDERHPVAIAVEPAGVARDALHVGGGRVDFALITSPDGLVGFDLRVEPGAPIAWQLFLDDARWPDDATFAGPFGLPAVAARTGIATDEARAEVFASMLPVIDPARDLGVFITRDKAENGHAAPDGPAAEAEGEGAKEMQRVLRDWGYAHPTR
jgi:arylsulfatase A-like enzyme